MKRLAVFDEEILKNVFITCVHVIGDEHPITFEISERRNDFAKMIEFFTSGKYVFVGYNCSGYDTIIMNMLIKEFTSLHSWEQITKKAKFLSDEIIDRTEIGVANNNVTPYKYLKYFDQMDLMTMLASMALRVGLKPLQVTMCYHNVKEMKIDWNKPLPIENFDELISYCGNDIGSTKELLSLLKANIVLRQGIQKKFGIECMSKDGVGIGTEIFTKYICEELGLGNPRDLYKYRDNYSAIYVKDFIVPQVEFKTQPLKDVRTFYENMVLDENGLGMKKNTMGDVLIGKLKHSFGLGGLHSQNRPGKYSTEGGKYILVDIDAASLYPEMADQWSFGPKGFKEEFLKVLRTLKTLRLTAKRSGDKVTDKTYKLALNAIIGQLRLVYSAYFAPEANTGICVNGQLFLLMLIEELHLRGMECIMSNTDGILMHIEADRHEELKEVITEWEKVSRMTMEYTYYESIAISSVGDYVAFKEGYSEIAHELELPKAEECIEFDFAFVKGAEKGNKITEYIKTKGAYIFYPRLTKGLDAVIVAKALINYFGRGIPIEKTVKDFKSIHDYLTYIKIGNQFTVEHNGEEQQHISRYYVSKNAPYLMKWKWVYSPTGNKKSYTNQLKGQGVILANDVTQLDYSKLNIDYDFYIRKCRDMIRAIEPEQLSLF